MPTIRQHLRSRHPALGQLVSIVQWARGLARPRFDPTVLTEVQRRDAGLDEAEMERARVLRRPLIR